MTPRYYAAVVRPDGSMMMPPNGPYDAYDGAMHVHALSAGMSPASRTESVAGNRRVLLDVSSVSGLDDPAWQRLLLRDPMLHAVYKMGESRGYERRRQEQNTSLRTLDGR